MKKQEVIDQLVANIPDNGMIGENTHFSIDNITIVASERSLNIISKGMTNKIAYDAITTIIIRYEYITVITNDSTFNCITY